MRHHLSVCVGCHRHDGALVLGLADSVAVVVPQSRVPAVLDHNNLASKLVAVHLRHVDVGEDKSVGAGTARWE